MKNAKNRPISVGISISFLKFAKKYGVLAHLVERTTGSVEVSGSSPLCSTTKKRDLDWFAFFFVIYVP